jgi:hypothetical protein
MNNGDQHPPKADDWLNLSYFQRRGIQDFNLSLSQVQSENFGEHTLRAMHDLQRRGRAQNLQEAFIQVEGLNRHQAHAVVQFDFRRNEVAAPNFGEHTLEAMYTLMHQNRVTNPYQVLEMVSGLTHFQTTGMVFFGLTRDQVSTPNFGQHILAGIGQLRANNQNLTDQAAFRMIQGLNPYQVHAMVILQLTKEQVDSRNFGEHTINTMLRLIGQNRARNTSEAFETLRGLDRHQAWGVDQYRLTRNEVMSPNFGRHTLLGMDELRFANHINQNREFTYQVSFQRLRGLNETQVNGVVEFNLNRTQVLNPRFGPGVLRTMHALQTLNIHASSNQLYDTAMRLPEYQIRAINVYGFIPQQLGLSFRDNQFVQHENNHPDIISGSMVDAIAHLMATESMNREEAYQVSRTLNSLQIIGMIDLGLDLEQVQSSFFATGQNVLSHLLDEVRGDNDEIELPLLPGQQQQAREIMNAFIANFDAVEQRTQNFSFQQQQGHEPTSASSALLEERRTELFRFLLLPNEQELPTPDVDKSHDFLRAVSNSDIFGIFDGVEEAICQRQQNSVQVSKSEESLLALEDEMLQAVVANTGTASMPNVDDVSISSTESNDSSRLNAFKSPARPNRNKSTTETKAGKLNLKAPPSQNVPDKKPSPKPKRKGPKP